MYQNVDSEIGYRTQQTIFHQSKQLQRKMSFTFKGKFTKLIGFRTRNLNHSSKKRAKTLYLGGLRAIPDTNCLKNNKTQWINHGDAKKESQRLLYGIYLKKEAQKVTFSWEKRRIFEFWRHLIQLKPLVESSQTAKKCSKTQISKSRIK